MTDYESRSAWRARPPNGSPGNLVVLDVEGCGVHWPGTTAGPIRGFDRVASALRGWQNYHMDAKGWSDIAYQIAVDQEGRAWTLRGWRTRSGANGNADLNGRFGAILLVLTPGEQPSEEMAATVRGVMADFRRIYPRGVRIVPHSAIRPDGTDCPGDPARAAINRGDFTPTSKPPEDGMSDAQVEELKAFIETRYQADRATLGAISRQAVSATEQAMAAKAAVEQLAKVVGVDLQYDQNQWGILTRIEEKVDALAPAEPAEPSP